MILFLLVFVFLCLVSICFRISVFHPWSVWRCFIQDVYLFFHEHRKNEAPYGTIKCYIAHQGTAFGTGKTLSATRELVNAYNKFNGKPIWCPRRKKVVTQRVHILSNVDLLSVPFERLVSLSQFVAETDQMQELDDDNGTLTVTYLFIDEASSQLNSRSFKSNFDAPFITISESASSIFGISVGTYSPLSSARPFIIACAADTSPSIPLVLIYFII